MTYDPIKTKAYKNAFYHMYVCPTSAHRGFRYEYRRYKDNTFTLKTTLFGWQSMISRFDLTLSNINMSKNSTFVWFFFLKSLYYQWLFVSLQHENPPSLSTMLKCAGRFCFYRYMATKIPFIKTYSTPQELVQLLKTRGMEITDEERLSIIFPTSVTIVCLPICTHCFLFPKSNIYSSKE